MLINYLFEYVIDELRYNFHGLAFIHHTFKRIINKESIFLCPESEIGHFIPYNSRWRLSDRGICYDSFMMLKRSWNMNLSSNPSSKTITYCIYAVLRLSDILGLCILNECYRVLRSD